MHRAFFDKGADGHQIEALKHWAAEAGARTASKDSHLVEELNTIQRGNRTAGSVLRTGLFDCVPPANEFAG